MAGRAGPESVLAEGGRRVSLMAKLRVANVTAGENGERQSDMRLG
jgi:hypothetical protein